MSPIRFVTLSSIAIAGLLGAAAKVAAQTPPQPEVFALFVAAFDGERTKAQFFGTFSTRERCGRGAQAVVEKLKPHAVAISFGCMSLDVDADYLAKVQAFEAQAQQPTSEEAPPKDVRRAPEA